MTTNRGAVLDALGDPTRRAIFDRLVTGPLPVGELASLLPVSRPAVSQHLKVLKKARLVRDRPDGTRRIYEVDQRGVGTLHDWLDTIWRGPLDAYARAAARDEEDR